MTSLTSGGSVEFRFYRSQAKHVFVAGDFNRWSKSATPMIPDADGWWVAKLPLPAGEYRFRYVADGHWYTDFASHGVERSQLGWNSVLVVPKRKPTRSAVEIKPDQMRKIAPIFFPSSELADRIVSPSSTIAQTPRALAM
jgi:1,4-alpha-glucan branching enzyme